MMPSGRPIACLAALVMLGVSQISLGAQPKEEDSAYQWGRWAVLSPAAGGAEPYVAVNTPGAEFNARPGDASEFQPEIVSFGEPTPTTGPSPAPPPVIDDPRDRLPPQPVVTDPRDRLPPR